MKGEFLMGKNAIVLVCIECCIFDGNELKVDERYIKLHELILTTSTTFRIELNGSEIIPVRIGKRKLFFFF